LQSELDLVERIARLVAVREGVALGIGDDAAILDVRPPVVVTQDLLVDGVHFRRSTARPADVGHKALAVNLSDLAAMGADPVAAFVGLGIPAEPPLTDGDVDEIYGAMEALASRHGLTIAGGDVTSAPALVLAVTAVGSMPPGRAPVRRDGARPGDLVCVTGTLGAAAAGLLIADGRAADVDRGLARPLVDAHLRPTPRLAEGGILADGGATAMLDCSDGLALDCLRLARASGVRVSLDLAAVPMADGVAVAAGAAGEDPRILAATGGDDYELIVALPPARVAAAAAALDVPLSVVGAVHAGPAALEVTDAGAPVRLNRLGWEHGADPAGG
jgi:thiamine-monophosphate kinase